MTTLLLLALLIQDGRDSIDELVRDLNDGRIEVRERAHARLIEVGAKCIPALRATLNSSDAELRHRATLILEIVEREEPERAHDEREKRALLLASRPAEARDAERAPGSAATGGARFDLKATAFGDGWIVATKPVNYLARRFDEGPGKGRLQFDIAEITDDAGEVLTVERCGQCSPGKVFVKAAGRSLKTRVAGVQTWFSPYPLVFDDPQEGQKKRVGRFEIVIGSAEGLGLAVNSKEGIPAEWSWSLDPGFDFKLKPGVLIGDWSRWIT